MTAAAAVVVFTVVRDLLAGYGGVWFLPAVAGEAARAALPFFGVGAGAWALGRRWLRPDALGATTTVVAATLLVLLFGDAWVAPHTGVARVVGTGATLAAVLGGAGAFLGLAIVWIAARTTRAFADAAVIALAGWLVLGPRLYARADDLAAGRRLGAALAIGAGFALLALVLALAGGRRRRGLGAALALAVAAALLAAGLTPGPHPARPAPSIVLVVVDTLRADMVDRESAEAGPVMPRLRDITAHGVRFTTAVSPSPWTLPSTVSLLSGLNPYRHGVGRMSGIVPLRGAPEAAYLGDALRSAGYQVAGFVNNPYLRPYYGFGRGFLDFERYHGRATDGTRLARRWIAAHRARPFMLLLHLMDPHWPYDAPAGFGAPRASCAPCDSLRMLQYDVTGPEVHAEVRRRYEAEVRFTDFALGELYDDLAARGVLRDAWLVVTADHGEELWDHRRFLHGHTLYDELLRVPLLIVPPGGVAGRTVATQVRLEDVAPTLLAIAGLGPGSPGVPAHLDGTSLLGLLPENAPPDPRPRPLLAGFLQLGDDLSYAMRTSHAKLVAWPWKRWPELYDLASDPGETVNLALQRPELLAQMQRIPALLGLDPDTPPGGARALAPPGRLDRQIEDELRSLGYVR